MGITISQGSVNTVSRLIRNEFDNIEWESITAYEKADNLIKTAFEYGLYELADEMKIDKTA